MIYRCVYMRLFGLHGTRIDRACVNGCARADELTGILFSRYVGSSSKDVSVQTVGYSVIEGCA